MVMPQKPQNEVQRLEELQSLNILDTLPEERFDRIIRVTHHLFHVPMISVSFIDKEREWFKSSFGLPFKETPRETSFGAYVILQDEALIVHDALNDARFKDNPLVVGTPNIRYYLGYPIKIKEKFNVGTLCLIDQKPQQFNDFDLGIIKKLAATIEVEFSEEHLSTVDKLTGLSNQQGFIAVGKQIINFCRQYDKNALLLYFDIKNFNTINESFGYEEGNRLLHDFAQLLLKNFRHTDAVARLGEDKFCVLCSGMLKEHVPNVIKRVQRKILALPTPFPIEFDTGFIQYDHHHLNSISALIESALGKIYEGKRHMH